jgi:hypothetical protein
MPDPRRLCQRWNRLSTTEAEEPSTPRTRRWSKPGEAMHHGRASARRSPVCPPSGAPLVRARGCAEEVHGYPVRDVRLQNITLTTSGSQAGPDPPYTTSFGSVPTPAETWMPGSSQIKFGQGVAEIAPPLPIGPRRSCSDYQPGRGCALAAQLARSRMNQLLRKSVSQTAGSDRRPRPRLAPSARPRLGAAPGGGRRSRRPPTSLHWGSARLGFPEFSVVATFRE